jgi:hypothetical protein
MRRHATFLGLTLAICALSMNDAAGQEVADKKQPKNEAVTKLLKIQLLAAQKVHRAAVQGMEVKRIGDMLVMVKANGRNTGRPDLVYIWSVRWLEAQRDLSATKDERIAAFADHHKRMKELHANVQFMVAGGNYGLLPESAVPESEWYLAEAELWLLKERGK